MPHPRSLATAPIMKVGERNLMSETPLATEHDIILKSREVIHRFYRRDIKPIAEMIDERFVWIGAYEFQYLVGRNAFLESIKSESAEDPVSLSQEEYRLLAHKQNLWVVYGRFTATIQQEDGSFLMAKIRNTFVWQQQENRLMLLHIHGSHARDVPLEYDGVPPSSFSEDKAWFDSLREVDRSVGPTRRLSFRTIEGDYRFLLPSEIRYVKAHEKLCTVHTQDESFQTRCSLKELQGESPLFLLIHRSHLVNAREIASVRRYTARLADGTLLPVSKEHYLDIRDHLQAQRH